MSIPRERDSFDFMTAAERQALLIKIAEFMEQQSRILGKPTPERALRYLPDRASAAPADT